MKKRWVILFILLFFCIGCPDAKSPTDATNNSSFSGTGPGITDAFTCGSRVDFHLTHDGSSNFIVWLREDGTAAQVELLANEIGAYDTTTTANLDAGKYYLHIEHADGNWTIDVN